MFCNPFHTILPEHCSPQAPRVVRQEACRELHEDILAHERELHRLACATDREIDAIARLRRKYQQLNF